MPLKLNVGLNRKVGEPNYGSRGASVHLELELESNLIGKPDRLQERIRQLFRLVEVSVNEELNATNGAARTHPQNGSSVSANGRTKAPRRATSAQCHALHSIADSQGIDLAALLQNRYGFEQPQDLSVIDASQLIDELKNLRE